MIDVRVPATTANMGAGFDCMGMALKLYNHIRAEEIEGGLVIESSLPGVPADETNLIYRSMLRFGDETGVRLRGGIRIVQEDNIPFTRGLGSSAACVVGGLLAANALTGANLSKKELAELAAKIETHPDNSTPAIIGGIVVAAMDGGKLEYIKIDTDKMIAGGLRFGVIIPAFTLATEKARGILPETYPRSDVVFNTSRAALTAAAFLTGDYSKLMMGTDDRIHQPYREKIIPGMREIFAAAKRLGVRSVFLSGAGPTIIAIYDRPEVKGGIEGYLNSLPNNWRLNELEPDNEGAVVR